MPLAKPCPVVESVRWRRDRAFDGTVRPLALGFLGLGAVALLLVLWAERGRLFQPLTRDAAPVVADMTEAPPERGFA